MPRPGWYNFRVILLISLALMGFLFSSPALLSQGFIGFSPSIPNVEEPVTFTLTPPGRFGGTVQWDFGDGALITSGPNETHAYSRLGIYGITATDLRGTSCCPLAITVTVAAAAAERPIVATLSAPFNISSIQPHFQDGKPYAPVARNFAPLMSCADIKYRG